LNKKNEEKLTELKSKVDVQEKELKQLVIEIETV